MLHRQTWSVLSHFFCIANFLLRERIQLVIFTIGVQPLFCFSNKVILILPSDQI